MKIMNRRLKAFLATILLEKNREKALEEIESCTRWDHSRGYRVAAGFVVDGSDEQFGVTYKMTHEGQRPELLSFWCDDRFSFKTAQFFAVLNSIDSSLLHSYRGNVEEDSPNDAEELTSALFEKLLRKIKEVEFNREEILRISSLL